MYEEFQDAGIELNYVELYIYNYFGLLWFLPPFGHFGLSLNPDMRSSAKLGEVPCLHVARAASRPFRQVCGSGLV